MFTKARGLNYGFPYRLKVTCPDQSSPQLFSWLFYKRFYVKSRFLLKHIIHVTPEDVSPTTYLQTATAIPDSDLIKFPNSNSNVIFRRTSMGSSTSIGLLQKRLKRACERDIDVPGRKKEIVEIEILENYRKQQQLKCIM